MARKMKTMDGNHAAAHASYAFSDVAAIYPITPSSVMAEATDEWETQGRRTSLGRKYRLLKCSLRLVLQVQFTDLWQLVPLQLLTQHLRVFF